MGTTERQPEDTRIGISGSRGREGIEALRQRDRRERQQPLLLVLALALAVAAVTGYGLLKDIRAAEAAGAPLRGMHAKP